MSRRLYLGRLSQDCREEDITKLLDGVGKVTDCRIIAGKGFGFVEFENARDAEDAVTQFNGKNFQGNSIVVEFAKEERRREPRHDDRGPPAPRTRRPQGVRISIAGLTRDTSWQDLKDFGRDGGNVSFSDIDRSGSGVLEYPTREDAEAAVKTLDGKELRGVTVRVTMGGGDGDFRREDRPRDRDRGYSRHDRDHDDRHRDDRRGGRYDRGRDDDRYRGGRNERSRSPRRDEGGYRNGRSPRRDYDRRARSPPPRKEYDDKRMEVDERPRSERYEERRARDEPPARRRDDDFAERRPAETGGEDWPARG